MLCSCGGYTKQTLHEVKTDNGKADWGVDREGAITVEQDRCYSCGRQRTRIYSESGDLLVERG